MSKRHVLKTLVFSLLALATAWAQAADPIKERMKDRLPEIRKQKDAGVLGETRFGYLAFVKGASAAKTAPTTAKLKKAENADRAVVYKKIAENARTDAATVGKRRALQIAKAAPKGDYLQKPDGSWYRKP